MAKPVLQVIIGSTRPGRVGPAVADWIIERARARGDFEVVVTDLAELNLPMFDEPNHPRLRQYVHQHTKDWSAIVEASDAFIFVIPEYNYGFNAATKNAIDYLNAGVAEQAGGHRQLRRRRGRHPGHADAQAGPVRGQDRADDRLGEHPVHPREAGRGRPAEAERDHGQAAATMLGELARYARPCARSGPANPR